MFRVLNNKTFLFGAATDALSSNVEIYSGSNGEIRLFLNNATSNYASLTYSRSTIGASIIRATGADLINHTLDVRAQSTTNATIRQIYVKNRIPRLQDNSMANTDVRFAGNLSLGSSLGTNLETVNTNRLSLEGGLRATISEYDPSTDQFKTEGIDGKGWMLNVEEGLNTNTQTAAGSTIDYFNVNRLGVQTIASVNGAVGDEVIYTDASTLLIDGAPLAESATSAITNAFALNVTGGTSVFGGNVGIKTTSPATFLQVGTYNAAEKYIDQVAYPDSPGENMMHIAAPSTTGRYGGGISWGGTTTSTANICARAAGASGALDISFGVGTTAAVTEEMRLLNNGDLHVNGDVISFSATLSDRRLKDNIKTIDGALDKVKALRGVEYDWNKGARKGTHDVGLIAQEVESVVPEIVHEHVMPLLEGDEDTVYKTVDYEKIVALLIEGMKEQDAKIEKLEKQINLK